MPLISIALIAFNLLALALIIVAGSAWRRRYRVSSLVGFLGAGLCVTLALLCGAITVGIRGYRALTQEVVAATIKTEPIAPQRFRATVTLPDGSLHMFDLAGRSEEHTSELQSRGHLVCRLLLEKKKHTEDNHRTRNKKTKRKKK